jgi:hypothetical protein
MDDIRYLVFGSGYLVLGLVLIGVFVKVFLDYRRKWAEVPPTERRRGQVTRAAGGGLAASVLMAALGGAIMAGGDLTILGWSGLVVVIACYALLYPLSDERRFI